MHYLISIAILVAIAVVLPFLGSPMSFEHQVTFCLAVFGALLGVVFYLLNRRREARHPANH